MTMTGRVPTMWVVHNDTDLDLVAGGFISIGWDEYGHLQPPLDRDAVKDRLAEIYPERKPGAIPGDAAVLIKFAQTMAVGDLVISPQRRDRTLNFGIVAGDFYTETDVETHRNRRPVRWVKTGVSRDDYPQTALAEIGGARTLFKVTRHVDVFASAFGHPADLMVDTDTADDDVDDEADYPVDEPNAEAVDEYTRDFIVKVLRVMDTTDFERLTAALLRAMGYEATATRQSGDGGVDVIASRDELALEPPVIKVQCKRTTATAGGPAVQQLLGTLAAGEVGLFVTLGAYSSEAIHLERTRNEIRLLTGLPQLLSRLDAWIGVLTWGNARAARLMACH